MRVVPSVTGITLLVIVTGCGSTGKVTRTSLPTTTPSDLNACSDYYAKCRDRCAPAEVEEATCFQAPGGSAQRVCECKHSPSNRRRVYGGEASLRTVPTVSPAWMSGRIEHPVPGVSSIGHSDMAEGGNP